jgi:hypothetical protein
MCNIVSINCITAKRCRKFLINYIANGNANSVCSIFVDAALQELHSLDHVAENN